MSEMAAATMRDAVISEITDQMSSDGRIFFLTADLGAPALDILRARHPDRFFNMGIAEQNLVATATGMALEGGVVFAYGLAPFVSMRAFEQIRNNLALFGQKRPVNVNLLALGAGLSYDVSGPTHHCLEDLSVIRTLPGIDLYSPSDAVLAVALLKRMIEVDRPGYLRLDGKPVRPLCSKDAPLDVDRGFRVLEEGNDLCIVSTGFPLHGCSTVVERLRNEGISAGLVDLFALRPHNEAALFETLCKYERVFSVEEAFVGRGGLDALLLSIFNKKGTRIALTAFGLSDSYLFENGTRASLQKIAGIDPESLLAEARALGRHP